VPYNCTGRTFHDSGGWHSTVCQAGGARRKVAYTRLTFGCRPSIVPRCACEALCIGPALVKNIGTQGRTQRMVSIVTQGTSLSGPSNARYRAVIIRGTIACCLYVKVIKIVKTCAFSRGKGTNGTEAGHHPERTRISSFSLTIRTSRLEPDKPEYQFGQRRNEKLSRLTLPVIRKTGCEPQLAPNRIDIWCFCNNKGVRHEEKMAPKCFWCCWCHMTSLERWFGQFGQLLEHGTYLHRSSSGCLDVAYLFRIGTVP
jgi:hypothetical protein